MNRKYNTSQKIVVNNKIEDLYTELINNAVFFPQISKQEKDRNQPEMFHSNLPNISDIINSKKKVIPDGVKETLIQLTDYARQLENLLRLKNKEIERLTFLNNFLSMTSLKKDELLESERKELNRVKDELSSLQAQFKDRQTQTPYRREARSQKNTIIIQQKDYGTVSPRLNTNTINNDGFAKTLQSKLQNEMQSSEDTQGLATMQPLKSRQSSKKKSMNPKDTNAAPNQPNIIINNVNSNQPVQFNIPQNNIRRSHQKGSLTEISATSLIPMNSYLAGDNQTDTLKTPTIINLNLNDDDALEVYNTNENISYLHKLIKDESKFQEFMSKANKITLGIIYERIRKALQDSKVFFLLLIRLKKIIRASFQMTKSLVLNDALESIVDETSICLECDRCTVYVVDEKKNELWSKVAKGTKNIIRMPINSGIAGFVATTKETLNILNAYADERFNKDIDKKMNYKSRTILCVPIIDEHGRVLGVIQCINKLNGHFTKDDEALLMMIADFSKIVLKNAINYNEQNLAHNKLRNIVNVRINIKKQCFNKIFQFQSQEVEKLLFSSERKLKDIMHIDDARIIINNMDGTMSYLNEDREKKIVNIDQGIAEVKIIRKYIQRYYNFKTIHYFLMGFTFLVKLNLLHLQNDINFETQLFTQNFSLVKTVKKYLKAKSTKFMIYIKKMSCLDQDNIKFTTLQEKSKNIHPKILQQIQIKGQVLTSKETVNCYNCYSHKQFSPEVDIITYMPTLCIPVMHQRCAEPLAVLEVVNIKGISSVYEQAFPKISHLDQEVLHYFVKQLGSALISRLEWFYGIKFDPILPTRNNIDNFNSSFSSDENDKPNENVNKINKQETLLQQD